jgi:hypothetical protein
MILRSQIMPQTRREAFANHDKTCFQNKQYISKIRFKKLKDIFDKKKSKEVAESKFEWIFNKYLKVE